MRKLIEEGDCLNVYAPDKEEGWRMRYSLSNDGVLEIEGNNILEGLWVQGHDMTYDSYWESQFADKDFHTVVIKEGVRSLYEGCFARCKGLNKVILPEGLLSIYAESFEGSPVEYLNEDGLLYLGTAQNPHYALMGCADDFREDVIRIHPDTVTVAHKAFGGKICIKHVVLPSNLVFLGYGAFGGTSITEVILPDGPVADEGGESLMAFDAPMSLEGTYDALVPCNLRHISVPFNMYQYYLKHKEDGGDWFNAWDDCTITFRNPDGTTAEEIHTPKRTPISEAELSLPETDKSIDSVDLPF